MIVALVGKPNVGKSTLFNRFAGKRKAIVDNTPGVTRDRIYCQVKWLDKEFDVIDTGGITNQDLSFQKNIEQQSRYAIDQADVILFIVSSKETIDSDDYYISKLLKKSKHKKILLVVNKSENSKFMNEKLFFSLGFGKPWYISAEHGIGIGDLLDEIIKYDTNNKNKFISKNLSLTFCIIGKTNVGKSTLTNSLLNEERVLVSPKPHTTRDSIDIEFKYNNNLYTIIDTAGIRRKGKIENDIEKYAVLRTQQSVERSEVVILLLDGSQPFNEQDEVIGGIAYKANIPTIICVNKWDLVKKDSSTMDKIVKDIRNRFKFLNWAPIIFISAKNKSRIHTIFETINEIKEQLKIKIGNSVLNDVLAKSQITNPPPNYCGGRLNILKATQVESQIPTFVIFVNHPKYLHLSYSRYLENQIRNSFGLNHVPITLYFKDKNARIRS